MTDLAEQISAVCTECELREEADDFAKLIEFATKHEQHTGHAVNWVTHAELGLDIFEQTDFVVHCSSCDQTEMFPTLEEAESYRDEHAEFTDHKADGISKEEMWRASCSWCGHSETFPDESSAEEWQESHRSQSDSHPREVEVTTSKTQRDRIKSIKSLVNRLESEHEDGAPLPLVHVLMENHGWLKSDVNDELEKLRRKGEVYEPRQGYLRCT